MHIPKLLEHDNASYHNNLSNWNKLLKNLDKAVKGKIKHKFKHFAKQKEHKKKCEPKKQANKFVCIYTCNKFTKSSNLCKNTNVTIQGNKKLDCSSNENYMTLESCCKDTEKQPYNTAKFVC